MDTSGPSTSQTPNTNASWSIGKVIKRNNNHTTKANKKCIDETKRNEQEWKYDETRKNLRPQIVYLWFWWLYLYKMNIDWRSICVFTLEHFNFHFFFSTALNYNITNYASIYAQSDSIRLTPYGSTDLTKTLIVLFAIRFSSFRSYCFYLLLLLLLYILSWNEFVCVSCMCILLIKQHGRREENDAYYSDFLFRDRQRRLIDWISFYPIFYLYFYLIRIYVIYVPRLV